MGFGQRVKEVLDSREMKPAELSRELGWNTGVLSQYIKNPDRSPTLSTACKIALALDVSLDYLGGLIDEPKPIARDKSANHTFDDLRQRDINDAFESVNEDGKQVMWTNSVMAKTTFPDLDKSSSVQEDVM